MQMQKWILVWLVWCVASAWAGPNEWLESIRTRGRGADRLLEDLTELDQHFANLEYDTKLDLADRVIRFHRLGVAPMTQPSRFAYLRTDSGFNKSLSDAGKESNLIPQDWERFSRAIQVALLARCSFWTLESQIKRIPPGNRNSSAFALTEAYLRKVIAAQDPAAWRLIGRDLDLRFFAMGFGGPTIGAIMARLGGDILVAVGSTLILYAGMVNIDRALQKRSARNERERLLVKAAQILADGVKSGRLFESDAFHFTCRQQLGVQGLVVAGAAP